MQNLPRYTGDRRFPDGLLFKMYAIKNRYLRRLIRVTLLRRRGAELYSRTLRAIFSKYHDVDIGMYSYGAFPVYLPPGTKIGRYTSIARGFEAINGSHPITHKSTHPFFYNPALGYVTDLLIERRKELAIGNDVYIGLDVSIYPAVTSIGDGAVIAAGSVVIKNVPPYAIVGGNPAKLIKFRFRPETIALLTASRWWEKDIEALYAECSEFASFLTPLEEPLLPPTSSLTDS